MKDFNSLRKLNNIIPVKERSKFTVFDIKVGGAVLVDQILYLVEDIYTYTYKKESWYEFKLKNVKTGEIAFLEFEEEDYIEYSFSKDALKRKDWPISVSEIEELVEHEEGFTFNGQSFFYEDDYKATFQRSSKSDKEKVYLYEFESDNGDYLTFERWSDNDFEAYFSTSPNEVSVVSLG